MRRLLVGLVLGTIIGSSGAIAAVQDLIVRPGTRATVQVGRAHATALAFPGLDLSCGYAITRGSFGAEPARAPLLYCSRKSVPGSFDPQAVQSRTIFVTRFRYYVTDNRGNVVYQVNRAP
jgi:hypothetical protein